MTEVHAAKSPKAKQGRAVPAGAAKKMNVQVNDRSVRKLSPLAALLLAAGAGCGFVEPEVRESSLLHEQEQTRQDSHANGRPRPRRNQPYEPRWLKAGYAAAQKGSAASSLEAEEFFEEAALAISREIQERHMPHGTILDPVFLTPDSGEIVGYSRAGDSAIWTGHYLAAEAFRYSVTRSGEALDNAKKALAGLRLLVEVTGTGLLARASFPADSPFAQGILLEEARHGFYPANLEGRTLYWIGNTSRDQYSGVFFGLSLAHDLIEDGEVRETIRNLVTAMLDFLLRNNWFVVMPEGGFSTVFHHRPDQQLALLQVGRQVNPERFSSTYGWHRWFLSGFVRVAIGGDVLDDHDTYFKFNLDTINLFNLIRLEEPGRYRDRYRAAYDVLWRTTDDHRNAHFNMMDRALKGPDAARDSQTIELLGEWLQRPRRDDWVDLRGHVSACGPDRACSPIPVPRQVRTDFLWQRSPFLLYGGGFGTIEGPGIDFILPYWMARYYSVL